MSSFLILRSSIFSVFSLFNLLMYKVCNITINISQKNKQKKPFRIFINIKYIRNIKKKSIPNHLNFFEI